MHLFFAYIKRRLGILHRPVVEPFRGYGDNRRVHLFGRVVEDIRLQRTTREDGMWKTARALIKRYMGSPIPNVRVKITFKGMSIITVTDATGVFRADIAISAKDLKEGWHEAHYMLLDTIVPHQGEVHALGEVLIELGNNSFGVISDIDDTILISNVTKKLKLLQLMLTKNAHSRTPFPGVAKFYQALVEGPTGTSSNPIFYVSSSQWNLYDLLEDFMYHNIIPKGPLLLKGIKNLKDLLRKVNEHEHKLTHIRQIFETYPTVSFILIGDSGQMDAYIYQIIATQYPERILAVYIRDVTTSKDPLVEKAVHALTPQTPVLVVRTTQEAEHHAREQGFIAPLPTLT